MTRTSNAKVDKVIIRQFPVLLAQLVVKSTPDALIWHVITYVGSVRKVDLGFQLCLMPSSANQIISLVSVAQVVPV